MDGPAALLEAKTDDDWVVKLRELLTTHGVDVLSTWKDGSTKHKHRLVHTAAMRSYPRALKAMAEIGFDLNVQRDSDKCTPLHLAIFFKKLAVVRTHALPRTRARAMRHALMTAYGMCRSIL
jgi:hypothetical protein